MKKLKNNQKLGRKKFKPAEISSRHSNSSFVAVDADVNSMNLSYGHNISQPGIRFSIIFDGMPK